MFWLVNPWSYSSSRYFGLTPNATVEKVGVSKSVVDAAGVSGDWVGVSGKTSISSVYGVSGVAVHGVGISLGLALADVVATGVSGKAGVASVSGVSNMAGVAGVGGDHRLVAGDRGNNGAIGLDGVVDGPHKRGGKTGVGGSYTAIGVSVQQRIGFGFSF